MSTVPQATGLNRIPLWRWIDRNICDLGRQMRLSYLPPIMVYMAAGVSGLTGIVGTFFVKEYLGLSAAFLAALGFWAGLPWAIKMPLGHLVDLMWKWKGVLVYLGASLIAAALLIMFALISQRAAMAAVMPVESWFVLAALLSPIGYVLQDVVADAMTVEAVPRVDEQGHPVPDAERRAGHVTMQTLGRVAIIGGGVLVSVINIVLFTDVETMDAPTKAAIYGKVYLLALVVPAISVLGVLLAGHLQRRECKRLAKTGLTPDEVEHRVYSHSDKPAVNWWILGGSLVFVVFTVTIGLSNVPYDQEIVFAGSMAIVIFLMLKLVRELEPEQRHVLIGTALLVFVFRAMPGPGAGATWWMIDELKFDQQFLAKLGLLGSTLTLFGMFLFRRFMADNSMAYVLGFLTIAATILSLPTLAMYHGFHHWTVAHTGGVVDARFIALVDTALESPLGQIAMIPMLAWIANSAPDRLKATYFAVMASFTNLALSLSQLGTEYLNQIWTVAREVRDPASAVVKVPADYSQLGELFVASIILNFALPMLAILFVRTTRFRSA
ncbi:MAG: hypothetical protein K2Y35_02290 [Burkholderiales bacterium]|nr:hypothetical protein [Burkholderiales bacterium]